MRQMHSKGYTVLRNVESPGGRPVLKAYRDGGGVPTIGHGHIKGVRMGMTCTDAQAERWLDEDADEAELAVAKYVKVPLSENQFAALVIFVFNVGVDAFRKSTLLRLLNKGDYAAVPAQLRRWCKDIDPRTGKMVTVRGLQKRREAEIDLWLEPEDQPELAMPVSWRPEEMGRRPTPPPAAESVLQTSTGKAQVGALAAGGTAAAVEVAKASFGDSLREVLAQIEPLAYVMDGLKYVLVGGTLVLIAWTLLDRRRKLREEGL